MNTLNVEYRKVEALKDGRVKPGSLLLMPGFGGGLTYGALLVAERDLETLDLRLRTVM